MSEAPKKDAHPETDPLHDLALQIYVELSARIYGSPAAPDTQRPQPKVLAQMSFKLAEAFIAANLELNPVAKARHEAKTKAGVDLSKVQLDFGAPAKG
jgi:hypothetical protein